MTAELSAAQRLDWLRLARSENVGPITFHQLLERFGTAAAALTALPDLARRGGGRTLKIAARADAEREMEATARIGARMIAWGEPDYPHLLTELDDAPPILAFAGHADLLRRPCVAIVGARNASVNGRRFAETLSRDLADAGWTIVSGLARGIDAAAHDGALAAAQGGTAAAIAGGIDIIYPPEHDALQHNIAERGALMTEAPFGTHPAARHFPRRNRIISGVSSGVVVVEAALRSGSLITARFAAEQGRDVFAVPGSPLDPRCRGTNGLIREGATLIEGAEDVLAVLKSPSLPLGERRRARFEGPPPTQPSDADLAAARREVFELLDPHPVGVDEILRRCQLSRAVILTVLLELELAGRLERHPGNRVSLLMEARSRSSAS